MAEILDGLAKVIRARFKLFRRVKAITAEAKWSGVFLSGFPVVAPVHRVPRGVEDLDRAGHGLRYQPAAVPVEHAIGVIAVLPGVGLGVVADSIHTLAHAHAGGEELTAASIAHQMGYEVAIVPGAEVVHDVDPQRFSFRHVRRTIIASGLVAYRMQRDLYIGMEESIGSTLRRLLKTPQHHAPGDGFFQRVLHCLYRKEASLRLLLAQLRDFHRRRRRPVSLGE